jgi:hypothetical protein
MRVSSPTIGVFNSTSQTHHCEPKSISYCIYPKRSTSSKKADMHSRPRFRTLLGTILFGMIAMVSAIGPVIFSNLLLPMDRRDRSSWSAITPQQAALTTINEIMAIANAHYNWLVTNFPNDFGTGPGTRLVAVLWDPTSMRTYAATIPSREWRNTLLSEIYSETPKVAPVWASLMSRNSIDTVHAEDGCFFTFEEANPQPQGAMNYRAGQPQPTVVAYGSMEDQGPAGVNLCAWRYIRGGRSSRGSCRDVAGALNVNFTVSGRWIGQLNKRDVLVIWPDDIDDPNVYGSAAALAGLPAECSSVTVMTAIPSASLSAFSQTCLATQSAGVQPTANIAVLLPSTTAVSGPITATVDLESIFTEPALPTTLATITAATPDSSTVSCELHFPDPDEGVASAHCVCAGSVTAPIQTPPPSISFTDPAQSCYYTTTPSATVHETLPTMTWTQYCSACTLTGGIANVASCTSVAGCTPPAQPTAQVFLGVNNSISVGTANNAPNNLTFAKNIFNNLTSLCTGGFVGGYCNAEQHAFHIPGIPTVMDDAVEHIDLGFTIVVSHVSDAKTAQTMLMKGVAGWQQAASQKCSTVSYQIAVPIEEDCKNVHAPIARDLSNLVSKRKAGFTPLLTSRGLEYRECCGVEPTKSCTFNAQLCSGPTTFSKPCTSYVGTRINPTS